MQKSYSKLVSQTTERMQVSRDSAVAAAVESLRRHSVHDTICLHCENDQDSHFQVTDIDDSGSVAEVKCKRCKKTSYVCHSRCYCDRNPNPSLNGLEFSYKSKLKEDAVQFNRASLHVCSIMEATVTLLRRNDGGGDRVCSCGNDDAHDMNVTDVDRLGFITGVQCSKCRQQLDLSPIEESYLVQMLYHEQSDQASAVQKVFNGDHVAHIDELCHLLRRHSFYADSICAEFRSDDRESCRVTAVSEESGEVTEVEFVTPTYNQRLQITCRSGCYYHQRSSPSQYELTYKERVGNHLETMRTAQSDGIRSTEAILSCTVLAANATILRRHNIDSKLCQRCKNDDHNFLTVVEIDRHGFIKRVECGKCRQSVSTACHRSRFYYEEIDKSMTLERGDHISWHRSLAYWHHAVVTRANDRKITVAHYGSNECSVIFHESVKDRQDISYSCLFGTPYRISYEDCYTNEYAALRAEKCVGEKQYNPFNRNCEHSSHWCKTGLSKSDQIRTCFSSVMKTSLALCLRVINMLLLMIFRVIHESREGIQIDRKAFERFEHIVTGVYIWLVFVLFLVWSVYTECNKLKPTSVNRCCCGRPQGTACGLFIRIVVRETLASLGPFLLIWFEDGLLPRGSLWERQVTIIVTLLAVTVVSYMLGSVLGTFVEHLLKCCERKLCVTSCTQKGTINDHSGRGTLPDVDPGTTELTATSRPIV